MQNNREQWLSDAVQALKPILTQAKLTLPPNEIKVSCGFPSKGGASAERRVTGETWPSAATFDNSIQIFVSPLEDEPATVLGILLRELIHACLPDDEGTGGTFKAAAQEIGFEGRPKNMTPGMLLIAKLDEVADGLGEYANKHLILAEKNKQNKKKKKTTFKLFCDGKRKCDTKRCSLTDKLVGEDYALSVTAKRLELGVPLCPCGEEMMLEDADYEIFTGKKREEAYEGTTAAE